MATYTSWGALEKALQNEMRSAMEEAMDLSKNAVEMETHAFYVGTPVMYERTGAFGNSPERSEVSGNGNSLYGEVKMNGDYGYSTGMQPSGYTVFNWAEEGSHGILGRTGTWERSLAQIEQAVNAAFVSHFGW